MKKLFFLFLVFTLSVSMSNPLDNKKEISLFQNSSCENTYAAAVEQIYDNTDEMIYLYGWMGYGVVEFLFEYEEDLLNQASDNYKACKTWGVDFNAN